MKTILPLALVLGLSVFTLRCSITPLAGGGTESTNGRIIGRLITADGVAAKRAKVMLVADDYDPVKDGPVPDSMTGLTDSLGAFAFAEIHTGDYSIIAIHGETKKSSVIRGVHVYDDGTDTLAADTLRPPGSIKVSLPPGADIGNGYVFIPGTVFFAFLKNSSGFAMLDSVSAGKTAAISYSTITASTPTTLRYGVFVASGDTTVIWNPGWSYARNITLNTAASGAGVSGTVTNFPLALRLTASNFDFTQAKNNGEDIRFTKQDGAPLPYEIERWDPAAKLAEIWVKVDTVRGNDSSQTLTMYWGASSSSATSMSNSQAVFDTAAGFAGVWHMGEKSGGLFDATGDHYNGVRNGNQTQRAGCIGYGQCFKDSGDYADMGNVCNPDTSAFSVCAWIKPVISKNYQTIISKSSGGAASSTYGWLVELDNTGALMTFIATGAGSWGGARTFVLASSAKIADSTLWHYVAAVFDRSGNGKCKVYLDGEDVSSLPAGGDITGLGSVVNSAPLRLGADANGGCPWKGCMDECSVSWKARSPDWVRLSYMNQKPDDKLTIFR